MLVIPQIFENLLLLSFMGVGYFFIERSRGYLGNLKAYLLHGICLGLTAALVTAAPVTLGDGATIDARAGPVVLAGVIAGPIGGLIAASMGAAARGAIGGSFAFSGVVVYFIYGLAGAALRHFRVVDAAALTRPRSIAVVVLTALLGACAAFGFIRPMSQALQWLRNDLPLILIANALSVAYATLMLGFAMTFLRTSAEVIEVNQTLSLAKRAGKFGVWDYDVAAQRLHWDTRSKELHGVIDESFTGSFEDWAAAVHPDDFDRTAAAFQRAMADDEPFDVEYRVVLPNGEQKRIKGDAVVLRDNWGKAVRVVGSNFDLTEIRAAEQELDQARSVAIQAQKFETIGQLTGGVAHDFNNLLAVVMGNLEILQLELARDTVAKDRVATLIDSSIDAARRGSDLTRNMLAYARKARLSPVVVDLNQVVRETEKWLRRTIESRIVIETVLQAGLWPILADRTSLQSAVVNLLVNARDSIDGAGRVTLETSNVRIDNEYVGERSEDIAPGRYVMLAVSDDGVGMTSDTVEKIFDPFFSTKAVGQGTGLGLSMVHGFVKQSNGSIRVYTEPGKGTSFKLYFPVAPGDAVREGLPTAGSSGAAAPASSEARILLVEDQPEVMAALRGILEASGFEVVCAESGDAAAELMGHDAQFDLVVTDIVMPGELQGPSLARRIRETHPDMRFVFLSGYASEATVHGNGLRPEDVRVMKPISRTDLRNAIEKSLADRTD